jgi:hypothetical protein
LSGLARQLQREKQLLEEDILSMSRKMDEEKNMFMATAKAKEMAVAELKLHIVKNDEAIFFSVCDPYKYSKKSFFGLIVLGFSRGLF